MHDTATTNGRWVEEIGQRLRELVTGIAQLQRGLVGRPRLYHGRRRAAAGNANSKSVLARLMNCEHEQRSGGRNGRRGVSYGRIVAAERLR